MKTKLTITWKYPDETTPHTRIYHGVCAETIRINNGSLLFKCSENDVTSLLWRLDHIISMTQEVED